MVRHDGRVGTDGLRQQPVRLGIPRRLLDDLVEGPDEVELTHVADLGERGGDTAPVEHAEQADRGEALRLPVQPPDPRPVLGGPQSVGEVQQPAVDEAAVVDAGPGVRVVHRRGAVGRKDGVPRAEGNAPQPVRHPVHCPGPAGDLHVVGPYEVAPQVLGGGEQPLVVAGSQPVVAVQEGEVLTRGGIQTGVARGGEPAVLFVSDHDRPGDVVPRAAQDVERPVRGTVVDEDELEVLTRVRAQASEGVGRVCLHVVERHDDGELNHGLHARRRPVMRLVPRKDKG